jgi:hypothetical protein
MIIDGKFMYAYKTRQQAILEATLWAVLAGG